MNCVQNSGTDPFTFTLIGSISTASPLSADL
jgi:hypothetical protein